MAAVGLGHVSGIGGVVPLDVTAQVGGDTAAFAEDLDRARRHAGVDHLVDVDVRDAVVVAVQLDVVVDVDLGGLEERQLVTLGRKGP